MLPGTPGMSAAGIPRRDAISVRPDLSGRRPGRSGRAAGHAGTSPARAARARRRGLQRVTGTGGEARTRLPAVLDPRCPPGPGDHRWNETTVLSSHAVHGEVTPLLVTRKRTEWYISSLSSPQASESGRALAAGSYCVAVLLKVMV